MHAIICGSRDHLLAIKNRQSIFTALDRMHEYEPIISIRVGSEKGVDAIAKLWGDSKGIPVAVIDANWTLFNRGAGPRRNNAMAAYFGADSCIFFPGGPGTASMETKAIAFQLRRYYFEYKDSGFQLKQIDP